MDIKFQIEENNIKEILFNENDSENYICSFNFISEEWNCLEKYVIFWDKDNKNTICSLGDKKQSNCFLPDFIKGNYFYIQLYASDEVLTQKVKINIKIEKEKKYPCQKKQQYCPSDKINETTCCSEREEILKEKNQVINKVEYLDNKLLVYVKNKLIKTIDILDDDLMQKIINGVAPQFIVDTVLSENSEHPLSNKAIYNALLDTLKKSDLSNVALTGDYNDLKNIPTEFNPKHHNHVVVDVIDYEENIDIDLNRLLDLLSDEIVKE